jgi:hypothetical protein
VGPIDTIFTVAGLLVLAGGYALVALPGAAAATRPGRGGARRLAPGRGEWQGNGKLLASSLERQRQGTRQRIQARKELQAEVFMIRRAAAAAERAQVTVAKIVLG